MSELPAWRKALNEFAAEARAMYGSRLCKLILYGSRARGDAEEDSDIDVLVVLESIDSAREEMERLNEPASRLSLEYGVVLMPLPVSQADLAHNPRSLYVNVRREGIPVE